jgi:hypothetical protein
MVSLTSNVDSLVQEQAHLNSLLSRFIEASTPSTESNGSSAAPTTSSSNDSNGSSKTPPPTSATSFSDLLPISALKPLDKKPNSPI